MAKVMPGKKIFCFKISFCHDKYCQKFSKICQIETKVETLSLLSITICCIGEINSLNKIRKRKEKEDYFNLLRSGTTAF